MRVIVMAVGVVCDFLLGAVVGMWADFLHRHICLYSCRLRRINERLLQRLQRRSPATLLQQVRRYRCSLLRLAHRFSIRPSTAYSFKLFLRLCDDRSLLHMYLQRPPEAARDSNTRHPYVEREGVTLRTVCKRKKPVTCQLTIVPTPKFQTFCLL